MKDPIFEGFAIKLRATGKGSATPREVIHDAYVGEVEFRRCDHAPLGTLGISWQPATQQSVFEDPKVALDRMTGNPTIAGDR